MSEITNDVRVNSFWHRMIYICTHMATVGVKRLMLNYSTTHSVTLIVWSDWWRQPSVNVKGLMTSVLLLPVFPYLPNTSFFRFFISFWYVTCPCSFCTKRHVNLFVNNKNNNNNNNNNNVPMSIRGLSFLTLACKSVHTHTIVLLGLETPLRCFSLNG